MPATVLLLHGFTGTARAWDAVAAALPAARYRPVAVDLRGHGAARDARPISFAACAADVLAAVAGPVVLCGYSLGGRIALHAALAAPERIQRLVLVATTAGIEDERERAERAAADARLARFAEQATIEEFAERWTTQSLFAGTPPAAARAWREDLMRNEPRALAAVLRGIGTGSMQPLWPRLSELEMAATVVAGEHDAKFRALGARLAAALPAGELVLVPGAGHGLPREAPEAIAEAIAR